MTHRKPLRRKPPTDPPLFAPLEPRQMMDGSALYYHGTWRVRGTNANDVIVVQADPANPARYQAVVNGRVVESRAKSIVHKILVTGGAGNDDLRIDLDSDAPKTFLHGGAGDDILRGGAGNDRLLGGPGNNTLDGRGGRDVLLAGPGTRPPTPPIDPPPVDPPPVTPPSRPRPPIGSPPTNYTKPAPIDRPVTGSDDAQNEQSLRQYIREAALARFGSVLGTHQDYYATEWGYNDYVRPPQETNFFTPITVGGGGFITMNPVLTASTDSAYAATSQTGTNIQAQGMDELDTIKTDGSRIYSIFGNTLTVIDASDPANLTLLADFQLDASRVGNNASLVLAGDRLAIVSTAYYAMPVYTNVYLSQRAEPSTWGGGQWPDNSAQTLLTVLDIADPASPQILGTESFDGVMTGARMTDGQLYLFEQSKINLPSPRFLTDEITPITLPLAAVPISSTLTLSYAQPLFFVPRNRGVTYESRDTYLAWLDSLPISAFLPKETSIAPDGQRTRISSVDLGTDQVLDPTSRDILQAMRIDLANYEPGLRGPDSSRTLFGVGNNTILYASADNFYVTQVKSEADWDLRQTQTTTTIYQFGLSDPSLPLLATGQVDGRVLNQYSIDEYDGRLRLATNSPRDWLGNTPSTNQVYVMSREGDALVVDGSLTGLGETESIYAVRFMGDRGYVVTFRRIDPLYALDLSDPANPTLAGELHVPGFSEYLHPVDENHLIAIGRDASEQGFTRGLQLSLFDVSDLSNPALQGTLPLGDDSWFDYSEAEHNPHAFSYFAAARLAATSFSDRNRNLRLVLVEVDPETGLTLRSTIDMGAASNSAARTFLIGDSLVAVSNYVAVSVSLDDPTTTRSQLAIRPQPQGNSRIPAVFF